MTKSNNALGTEEENPVTDLLIHGIGDRQGWHEKSAEEEQPILKKKKNATHIESITLDPFLTYRNKFQMD